MSESRNETVALENSYNDFLEKSGIKKHVKDATVKLIENKPSEPMLFLAQYFEDLCNTEQNDKILSAYQVLKLANYSKPTFQTNLMIAYDVLSAPKNPNSKKAVYNRSGLIGLVYNDMIKEIIKDIPENIQEILLEKIEARANEMIPFEVFKYGMNVSLILKDFITTAKHIFTLLQGHNKSSGVDKRICDTAIDAFEKSIKTTHNTTDPISILNANKLFRPDSLALSMLETKNRKTVDFVDEDDFIFSLSRSYLNNLKDLS